LWPGRAKVDFKLDAVNQSLKAGQPGNSERITKGRLWPGRAKAALKFVAGKLTFAGMPRPSFRVRREGPLMAETGASSLSTRITPSDGEIRALIAVAARRAITNMSRCPDAMQVARGMIESAVLRLRPPAPISSLTLSTMSLNVVGVLRRPIWM
jgi:hypothetical protein